MPFITVAIPTYRRLPMLRRAIESVFAQTFTDWELGVSDDEAPPGETWNFLESLAADARVRPIRNVSPHGASFNHSSALKAARGQWIKFLHDDDVLKPNCLEVLATIVKEYPCTIAVSCACEQFLDGKLVGGLIGATEQSWNRWSRELLFLTETDDSAYLNNVANLVATASTRVVLCRAIHLMPRVVHRASRSAGMRLLPFPSFNHRLECL